MPVFKSQLCQIIEVCVQTDYPTSIFFKLITFKVLMRILPTSYLYLEAAHGTVAALSPSVSVYSVLSI